MELGYQEFETVQSRVMTWLLPSTIQVFILLQLIISFVKGS